MRILLIHNFYQSTAPSGEDGVYRNERELLQHAGHEVIEYTAHNDDIPSGALRQIRTAAQSAWSRRTYRELTALIRRTRPQVAHAHNTFPLITPSAYGACRDNGVAVVQTLHNYRLLCPSGLFMRNGRPCEQCLDRTLLQAVRHGCYRSSRIASGVVAAGLQVNRLMGTYAHLVDRYIALTQFAKERFVRGGLPAHRIVVRANGLPDTPACGTGDGGYALFVGRLTTEKGAETMLRAWQRLTQLPLKIVGDGALRDELERRYAAPHVQFLGRRPQAEVWDYMRRAVLLVVPSECYEGFPLTVLEAYATGTPVIASRIGALDEIVGDPQNGAKFEAGNAESLEGTVRRLLSDPSLLQDVRLANRTAYDTLYGPAPALRSLEAIYADALGAHTCASQARSSIGPRAVAKHP